MINLGLLYFLNLFSTGLLFMAGIAVLFTGHKKLSPVIHSIYWFINFFAVLMYNLEFTGKLKYDISISSCLFMIIPLFMFIYLVAVIYQKIQIKHMLIVILLLPFILLKDKIALFQLFYIMFLVTIISLFSIYIYIKKKKINLIIDKKYIYTFFWIQLIIAGFLPYIVVNIILSMKQKYLIHLQGILPISLAFSSLMIYFLYYKYSQFYTNEDIKENHIQEKMSLIEKIAASIIHEIKNPVAAIQSLNEQLLERRTSMSDESIIKYHSIIDNDIRRIKSLADTFLNTFKEKESEEEKEISLFITFQSIIDLLRFDALKKEINITVDKSIIDKSVKINNYYFRQIFLNLIYNSIEAGAKNINIYGQNVNDGYKVFIKDDGEGIKLKDHINIFKPFFTTKSEGTGLGLSICQKIISKYNGKINFVSSGKEGTVFSVLFYESNK